MAAPAHDSPGVPVPPPLLFIVGFLAGLLADGVVPLALLGAGRRGAAVWLGWGAVVCGLVLMLWGIATFARSRTAVMPHLPASRLVTAGPYRFTRNPMYVGLTLAYAGIALLIDTAWPLLTLPAVLATLVVVVVRREERYLDRAFGEAYREYRGRVRRWL
jgi:protein-S-isoprenylcysteine O-methyltransferase Ste14